MTDHVEIIRQHNVWRRGGDGPQTDPIELGRAIEATIAEVEAFRRRSDKTLCQQEEIERLRAALQISTNGLRHCANWYISDEKQKALMAVVMENEAILQESAK